MHMVDNLSIKGGELDSPPSPLQVYIRWMINKEIPHIVKMEKNLFKENALTEHEFLNMLRCRNMIGMVAESKDDIVGYIIYELCKDKLHLHNIAVGKEWQRRKVGTQMIQKLISKLSPHKRTHITLMVADSNLTAHLFFKNNKFRAYNVVKTPYIVCDNDGYEFIFKI